MSVLFPVVPDQPGVPPLNRALGAVNAVGLLIADGLLLTAQPPRWAIFNNQGNLAIQPDSFFTYGDRNDWAVADFPIEQGGFATYDKVRVAPERRLQITKGGNAAVRTAFLAQCQRMAADSQNFYFVQTPELMVGPLTVEHMEYDRSAREGMTLLTVDLWFKLVVLVSSQTIQNTATPSGAGQVNGGTVQPFSLGGAGFPGMPSLGGQMGGLSTRLGSLSGALNGAGLPSLSSIGGSLDQLSSLIGAQGLSIAGLDPTSALAPTSLLNAGDLVNSVTPQLSQLQTMMPDLSGSLQTSISPMLSQLQSQVPDLSEQLINSSTILSAGGNIGGFAFPPPGLPSAALPSLPASAPVNVPGLGPLSASTTVTFGPVFPGQVH